MADRYIAHWSDGRRVEIEVEWRQARPWISAGYVANVVGDRDRCTMPHDNAERAVGDMIVSVGGFDPPTEILRPGEPTRAELLARIEQARTTLTGVLHHEDCDQDTADGCEIGCPARIARVALAALDGQGGERG